MSGFKSQKVRNVLIASILIILLVFSVAFYTKIGPFQNTSTSEGSQETSFDNTFAWNFAFPVSVNYSGSWMLAYWAENGGPTQNNVKGNISGSGNYMTTVTLYGVGYVERTLCANATKLDTKQNSTLTLTVLAQTNSTTAFTRSVEACGTAAP